MSLPLLLLILSATTVVLALLPIIWLWRARTHRTRDWLSTLAIASVLELVAYAAGTWPVVSYTVRSAAVLAFGTVAVLSLWHRRRLARRQPTVPIPPARLVLRALALVLVLALDVLILRTWRRPEAALDVMFPLESGTYVVLQGGDSPITNPFHRANPREHLALDLVRLNAFGSRASGLAPRALGAYAIFGAAVASPCDGVVLEVLDGVPDNPPGRMDAARPAGNHVVLRCGGVEVLLAHLTPGTVAVHAMQPVGGGQLLGRVGNSGNTSEPHLHISASRTGDGGHGGNAVAVPLTFGGRYLRLNSVYTAALGTGLKGTSQTEARPPGCTEPPPG